MAEQPEQLFNLFRVFVKDVSFEAPKAAELFTGDSNWKPEVSIQLNSEARNLQKAFEVVLTITVTAKLGEETAYLAEVKQCGLFRIEGFDEPTQHQLMGAYCPNVLFPFARQTICDLVVNGGFPQLLLDPINFEALYQQQLAQQQQNAPSTETEQ